MYEVTTAELYHHGIKGQHWGVRRYQNKDGSYTDAGRRRLGIGSPRNFIANRQQAREAASERRFQRSQAKAQTKNSRAAIKTQQQIAKTQLKSQRVASKQQYKLMRQQEKTKQLQAKADIKRLKAQAQSEKNRASQLKIDKRNQKLQAKVVNEQLKTQRARQKAERKAIKAEQKYNKLDADASAARIRRGKILVGAAVAGTAAVAILGKDRTREGLKQLGQDYREKHGVHTENGKTTVDKKKVAIGAIATAMTVNRLLGISKSAKRAQQQNTAREQYDNAQAVLNGGRNNQNGNSLGRDRSRQLSDAARVAGLTAAGIGTAAAGYKAYKSYKNTKATNDSLKGLSDSELNERLKRMGKEKQYRDLSSNTVSDGQAKTETILRNLGNAATLVSTLVNVASTVEQMRRR